MKQAILIMVDTERQDMLSCYDPDAPETEHLDALAASGTRFTSGYTCQPVCGPARSAIFTGLYPHTNGMETNCMPLRQNVKNAGEWLTPFGIACGYVGKWHLDGGDYFGYGRCPNGYLADYWYDMRNFLDELTDDERKKSRRNMGGRADDPNQNDTYAHRAADRAIRFLQDYRDKDFFLTLSLDEPHDPSVCPRRFFKVLKDCNFKFHRTPNVKASLKQKPAHQRIWAREYRGIPFSAYRKGLNALFACNLFCDYEIGRVLAKVKELGLDPLIVYTADHGDMLLSHGIVGKGAVMYDEITKIPLLVAGGGFPKGAVSATPVSHVDLLPTVMRHLSVPIPKMLQGAPLQDLESNQKREVFIEFTRYEVDHDGFMGFQPIRAICDGAWKLVVNLLTTDELYCLGDDPFEKNNLIDDKRYVRVRNALHDRLIEHMNVTRDLYRGYYWHCRPWRTDVKPSFRHTGYTRQLEEEDFVQLDYATGLPMRSATRKK